MKAVPSLLGGADGPVEAGHLAWTPKERESRRGSLEGHGQRTLLECESWICFKTSLLHAVAPAVIPRLLWPLDPGEVPCACPHLGRRRIAPAAWSTRVPKTVDTPSRGDKVQCSRFIE